MEEHFEPLENKKYEEGREVVEEAPEWPVGWDRKTRRSFKAALARTVKKGAPRGSKEFDAILKRYGFTPNKGTK